MKNIFFIMIFILFAALFSSCAVKDGPSQSASQRPSWSGAIYCEVESAQVCAVAQSEDDCKKLGGKKVSACKK